MAIACKEWRRRPTRLRKCSSAFCLTHWRWAWSKPGRSSSPRCWLRPEHPATEAAGIRLPGTPAAESLHSRRWNLPLLSATRFPALFLPRRLQHPPLPAPAVEDRPAAEAVVAGEEDGRGRFRRRLTQITQIKMRSYSRAEHISGL